jgi:hypothetical protein
MDSGKTTSAPLFRDHLVAIIMVMLVVIRGIVVITMGMMAIIMIMLRLSGAYMVHTKKTGLFLSFSDVSDRNPTAQLAAR